MTDPIYLILLSAGPKPVTSVHKKQVGSHSLTLQLVNKDKNEGESYCLHVYSSVENKTVTSDNETTTIEGLHPGTRYTVEIYTYYKDLKSERFLTIMEYTSKYLLYCSAKIIVSYSCTSLQYVSLS